MLLVEYQTIKFFNTFSRRETTQSSQRTRSNLTLRYIRPQYGGDDVDVQSVSKRVIKSLENSRSIHSAKTTAM